MVRLTCPFAMPSHDSAALVAVIEMAKNPDQGQRCEDAENATSTRSPFSGI